MHKDIQINQTLHKIFCPIMDLENPPKGEDPS